MKKCVLYYSIYGDFIYHVAQMHDQLLCWQGFGAGVGNWSREGEDSESEVSLEVESEPEASESVLNLVTPWT